MIEEESKEDPSELIYNLPKRFMMTWEELMDRTSTTGYDIWSEDVPETKNYSNPQMGEDTSNPNQTTKHLQMGGDTSNPNQTLAHKWGETLQTPRY